MAKILNLKPEEEITSVIERLWETGEEEVFLVAPKESALFRNIIGLKLLKREADRLGKEILIVTKDEVAREMAKRIGLASRVSLPKEKKADVDFRDDEVLHEVSPKKFEAFLEEEVAEKRHSPSGHFGMSDIRPKGKLGGSNLLKEAVKIPLAVEDDFEEEEVIIRSNKKNEPEIEPDILSQELEEEPSLADDLPFDEPMELEDSEEASEPSAEFIQKKIDDSYFDRIEENQEFETTREENKKRRSLFGWFKNFSSLPKRQVAPGEKRIRVKNEDGSGLFEAVGKKIDAPLFSGKFLFLFVSTVLIVAAAVLYFVLPKAEIEIIPKAEELSQNLNILVDKGISKPDDAQNKVPAQLIKLDKKDSREFPATGQRQVNEKARGTITVYNEYSSSPQSLVEKTRFEAENGKVFRTTKTVVVPGAKIVDGKIMASSINVEAVADQPGSDYNIAGGRFSIPGFSGTPKFNAFYGRSDKGFSGGASGLMKVVSQDDFDKAKAQFGEELKLALDKEFKTQIPSGLKMLDAALKEDLFSVESSVGVGQPGDNFTLTIKAAANVLLFDEKDILTVIEKKVKDKSGIKEEIELKLDKIEYQLVGLPDFSRGQMNLLVKLNGKMVWPIGVEEIKKAIIGKGERAMRDYFAQHSEVAEVKVSFWPFWVKSVPVNLDKIKIILGD